MHYCCVWFQPTTKLFLDGKFVESKTNEWIDLYNPVSFWHKCKCRWLFIYN